MDILQLKQMLTHFFQEDIGTGDATSQAIFADQQCKARIIAKTDGVFAGEAVIREGWKLLHICFSCRMSIVPQSFRFF